MGQAAGAVSLVLRDVYARLRGHFGYAPQWWPGTPLEIVLTAILVQQCDWGAAWKAVGRLREGGLLSLSRLAAAHPDGVRACIRGVAFAPTKATRLIELAAALSERGYSEVEAYLSTSRDTAALRAELLSLPGIGEQTADCLLLFAGGHACFVVDAYTRRAFRRLGVLPGCGEAFWAQPYGRLKTFLETHVLADLSLYDTFTFALGVRREVALLRDFHAQLVELGKHHCLKTAPRCHTSGRAGWVGYVLCETHCQRAGCNRCPLSGVCGTARETDLLR
jgi:endonuclease-3 related protein